MFHPLNSTTTNKENLGNVPEDAAMMKLEIGPRSDGRSPDGDSSGSWDTLDSSYAATYRVKWGEGQLPIKQLTYDWVHASHVLEHLPWWKTLDALTELHRILKIGGRCTIWVPDAMKIIRMAEEEPEHLQELEKSWSCGRGQNGTIDNLNPDRDPWVYMNARVFWGARPGELGQEQHFHRAMFGEKSLEDLMLKAGFCRVKKLKRNTAVDPGHGWMEIGMEGYR